MIAEVRKDIVNGSIINQTIQNIDLQRDRIDDETAAKEIANTSKIN